MTWQQIAVAILLVCAVGLELACCIGILVMDDVYDRLHYLGPATTLGPAAVALAVVIQFGLGEAGIYTIMTAVTLLLVSPVLTHATARGARTRQFGHWTPQPDEKVEDV